MRLGLSIPLFNEEELVTEVVASIQACLQNAGIEHTLVLVNNGSHDRTGDIIRDIHQPGQIEGVHLFKNFGYGGGILAGIAHLEQTGLPDVVGWCWGDGQVSAQVLPPLFAAVVAGSDIAKVKRTERHDGLQRQVVTHAYAGLMRVLGVRDPDINGCPKLMSRQAFETIQPQSKDWFIDAETIIKAEALGLSIHQHSAVMRARQAGISKVRLKTLAEFGWNISRWKVTGRT